VTADLPLDVRPYFEQEFSYFNASGYVCSCMPGFEGNPIASEWDRVAKYFLAQLTKMK
jgi:hypothetical protein